MEQRNLLLAIVISVGVLVGVQLLFAKFLPPPPPNPEPTAQTSPATPAPSVATPGPAATAPGVTATEQAPQTREAAIASQPRLRIDTPRLHGSIALDGGRIDDLTLATYHETVDPKSPEVVLLWPTGTKEPYFAEFGWVAGTPRSEERRVGK